MKILKKKFFLLILLSFICIFVRWLFHWHIFEQKIDYSQLENYLSSQKWKQADIETAFIYRKLVSNYMREEGFLGKIAFDFLANKEAFIYQKGKLPCHKLKTIDKLWLKYSQGRFGFSIQAQIMDSIRNSRIEGFKTDIFIQEVGWDETLPHRFSDYDYSISLGRPLGYLPSTSWIMLYFISEEYSEIRNLFIVIQRQYVSPIPFLDNFKSCIDKSAIRINETQDSH